MPSTEASRRNIALAHANRLKRHNANEQKSEDHIHAYNDEWHCKCGFLLPLELRPEQHGFPAVSGDGGKTVAGPRSYVDMGTWFRNMKEYAPPMQGELVRGTRNGGLLPYRWQKLDDKDR